MAIDQQLIGVILRNNRLGQCSKGSRCGLINLCPMCSKAKLGQRLQKAQEVLRKYPGRALLITLTIKHYPEQPLYELLAKLRSGLAHRAWKRALRKCGVVAGVRSLETTFNELWGWHPHVHLFVRVREDMDAERCREILRLGWLAAMGRRPSEEGAEHAVDVQDGDDDDDLDYTLKDGQLRSGKGSGNGSPRSLSIWELMEIACDGESWAIEAVVEYGEVMHGQRRTHLWYPRPDRKADVPSAQGERPAPVSS